MTQYVCGFYFDHVFRKVVLIWKNKPAWQKGKLNGVGGKIEPGETSMEAMIREFREEAGIIHKEWVTLVTLTGEDWKVYFFCAKAVPNQFEYAETKEEEEVAKMDVDRLDDFEYIPNLRWLIPMGIHKLKFPEEKMSFENYYNIPTPNTKDNNP